MSKDLTTPPVARQNVLSDPYALSQLKNHLTLSGLTFEGETFSIKGQAADTLTVDERAIDKRLASSVDDLRANGYCVMRRKSINNITLAYVDDTHVDDTHVVDILDSKVRRFICNKVDCARVVFNPANVKAAV